jgi:8-oxo-dGTP diphosphatase
MILGKPNPMHKVATALLFDCNNKLLIYLRDDKPGIPFPNHWDLFGGHVDEGELPEQALVRELKEELNIDIADYRFYKCFESLSEERPNTKFVYVVRINQQADELTLLEGQYLKGIELSEHAQYRFANMLAEIIADYASIQHIKH